MTEKKLKKITIILFVIVSLYGYQTFKENKVEKNTNLIAYYVETSYKSETYENVGFEPDMYKYYMFNKEKTTCINSSIIEDATSVEYQVELTVYSSDSCSIYFDLKNTLSNIVVSEDNSPTTGYLEFDKKETDSIFYATPDNYDEYSYVFRGPVNNNWVKFAGFYWRIIRVNGDGSVRLIYSGSTAPTSSQSIVKTGSDTYISSGSYSSSSSGPFYTGYMYTASTTAASTSLGIFSNTTSSTVKNTLDSWYVTNIKNKGYEEYVADTINCADRTSYTNTSGTSTNTTVNYNAQYFGGYIRLETNKDPSLKCSKLNDSFTVTSSSIDNGKLTYPVGLITADEASFAGLIDGTSDTSNYLYTGQNYFTMTPYSYSGSAQIFVINSSGQLGSYTTTSSATIRPVISVTKDVLVIQGNGTYNNPYEI